MLKSFKQHIREGGNVQIGIKSAQRIDLKKIRRDDIIPSIEKTLDAFNLAFQKEHNIPIWSSDLFKSKEYLSGSAFHFFNDAISTPEFSQYKNTVGDIDTQVDRTLKDQVEAFLTSSAGKMFGDATLIGHKNSAGQSISLWEYPKFNINIQVDFEYVDFLNGKPTPWSVFSHSSDWNDIKAGVKGVFQKYAIRALTAKTLRDIIILKGKKETPTKVASTDLAFSVTSGLRTKIEPVLDSGVHRKIDNLLVYREIPTSQSTYITDLEVMFSVIFNRKPSAQDMTKFGSFLGIIDLVKQHFSASQKESFIRGFANTLWGSGAQSLYRGDPENDNRDKMISYNKMIEELGVSPSVASQIDQMKSNYYESF